jgi:hypothetical protein
MKRFQIKEVRDNYVSAHYIDCDYTCEQISPFCVKLDNSVIITFMNEIIGITDCSGEIQKYNINKINVIKNRLLENKTVEVEMIKDFSTKEILQLSHLLTQEIEKTKEDNELLIIGGQELLNIRDKYKLSSNLLKQAILSGVSIKEIKDLLLKISKAEIETDINNAFNMFLVYKSIENKVYNN